MEAPGALADPRRSRTSGGHEAEPARSGPGQLDPWAFAIGAVGHLAAPEYALEHRPGRARVGDGQRQMVEPGGSSGRGRRAAPEVVGFAVAGLGQLHHDAAGVGGEQERLLPVGLAAVDAGGLDVAGRQAGQHVVEVGHLEGDVVRARAETVEEAAEEVELVGAGRLEPFHAHAVGVGHLGPVEAGRRSAAHPCPAELAEVAGPQVVEALGGDGEVIEVDGVGHGPDHGRGQRREPTRLTGSACGVTPDRTGPRRRTGPQRRADRHRPPRPRRGPARRSSGRG